MCRDWTGHVATGLEHIHGGKGYPAGMLAEHNTSRLTERLIDREAENVGIV